MHPQAVALRHVLHMKFSIALVCQSRKHHHVTKPETCHVQELAPQDAKGGYQRPSYAFDSRIGDTQFPIAQNRCGLSQQSEYCLPGAPVPVDYN